MTTHDRVADPAKLLALGVIGEALKDAVGRRWLRTELGRGWCHLADTDWPTICRRADELDGYPTWRCA